MNDSLALLDQEMKDLMLHAGSGATFPPNCFVAMKAQFVEYESRKSLTVSFPVLEESLNPLRAMQGGFLVAAFDNVFGPLSYLAARAPCITLSLHTQFIRPVNPGATLIVRAEIISRGFQVLHMSGEAFDQRKRLVALANATASVLDSESRPAL